MVDDDLQQLCDAGAAFYARGEAFGGTGNLSVRTRDAIWITPTGRPLRGLSIDQLAKLDPAGKSMNGGKPSKEYPFHLEVYRRRPDINAVVHLHAPHSTALSCLEGLDSEEPLPPITPYYVMRVAPLGVVPYLRPGSDDLAGRVGELVEGYNCLLLQNHGSICVGSSLAEAVDRALELEETCKLFFLLRGERVRQLTAGEVHELQERFVQRR